MEFDIGKIILEDEIDIGETKLEEEVDIGNIKTDYQSEQIVTSNYEELNNLPKINNVEIIGNKSLEELGIKQEYTANDITFEDGTTFQEKYDSGELKGADGKDGTDGIDGYTPIKGEDYYTEADKQEMVQLVLNALPSANEVSY